MICPKCNGEIADNAKFCTKCGANIEEVTKELEAKREEEVRKVEEQKVKEVEEVSKVEEQEVKEAEEVRETEKQATKETEEAREVEEELKSEKTQPIADSNDEEPTQNPKNEQPKKAKKGKKKIILVIAIIIVLLAGVGAGVWYYMSANNDSETATEQKKLEWGDVYLEVLNDNSKLDDMDNQKIQLCDLDKDTIPELIIYGIKNAKEYIANIYKLNEKNEVDTIKVSLDNEFDLKLVYDANKDDYVWYAVEKTSDNSSKYYDLNLDSKEYKPEEVGLTKNTDCIEVDENYSKKVDFDKNASKKDKEKVFEEAQKDYVETDDMITDEVKEKVKAVKILKNIKKLDNSKEIVYSAVSKTISGNTYEYPCINIDSADVATINAEIKKRFGFSANMNASNYYDQVGYETEEISYSYTINKSVLSVLVWSGGNETITANTYNVDLQTLSKISSENLIKQYNASKDEVITKATEAVKKECDTLVAKEKTALGSNWSTLYDDKTVTEWQNAIKKSIEKLNVYINDKNELCILGEFEHAGGQWSCTQTVIVNITNGYKASELTFKGGKAIKHYIENYKEENTTPSTSPSSTPSSVPSSTPATSASTSEEPTEKGAIGKDQAQKLAEKVWGSTSDETGNKIGYTYTGWGKDSAGKQYYIFNARWLVGDHWSYIGTICIAADGKTYKQLDTVVNDTAKGETFNMLDGGNIKNN